MKKLRTVWMLVMVCLGILSFNKPVLADSVTDDGFYYRMVEGGVSITGCTDQVVGDIVIPSEVDGLPVCSIGSYAFQENRNLTGIVVPNTVTELGVQSFCYCTNCTYIKIFGPVTYLPSGVFADCDNLREVYLPGTIKSAGDTIFYYSPVQDVYFAGTAEQWNSISWGTLSFWCTMFGKNTITVHCGYYSPDFIIVGTGDPEPSNPGTPSKFNPVGYNDHFYYVFPENTADTYSDAQQYCLSRGGHLATISDSDENDFIYNYMKSQGYDSAYLGYSYEEQNGTWNWCTDEKITYSNWHAGEPDSENTNEDYAMFNLTSSDGTWSGGSFSADAAFVCEWDNETNIIIPENFTVSLEKEEYSYTGKYIEPAVIVKDQKGNIISSENYTVTYSDNKYVGTAKVTVVGITGCEGTVVKEFTIKSSGKVTITFDANGGSVSPKSKKYAKGDVYGSLPTPTRKGYAFSGWYTEKSDGKKITESSRATGKKTLYAHWQKAFTIQYNANGGTGTMPSTEVIYGTATPLRENAFKKSGYSFAGWTAYRKSDSKYYAVKKDGSKLWATAKEISNKGYSKYLYSDQTSVSKTSSVAGDIVTMTAQWQPTYTIEYNANGGTGTMPSTTVVYGVSTPLRENVFKRNGYSFAGWTAYRKSDAKYYAIKNDGSKLWATAKTISNKGYTQYLYPDQTSVSKTTSVAGDVVTMTAQWQSNTFTIQYDANGGIGTMSPTKVNYGVSTKLRPNSFSREGYEFAGWKAYRQNDNKWYAKKSDGTAAWCTKDAIEKNGYSYYRYNNASKVSKTSSVNNDVVIMYAVWKVRRYVKLENIDGADKGAVYQSAFDEDFFREPNTVTIAGEGLARVSAAAALSTYGSQTQQYYSSQAQKYYDSQTEAFLADCCFYRIEKFTTVPGNGNSTRDENENDNATVYLGIQELDDGTTLVAIIISGYTKGGYEWISNFELGTDDYHYGFKTAADKLMPIIKSYLNDIDKTKAKFWITGHSRGAAITNLVAVNLINKYKNTDNIYAYGFATPRYTTLIEPTKKYDTILNYINPHDFVPYVAPEVWGYKRFGTNIEFTDSDVLTGQMVYQQYETNKFYYGTTSRRENLVNAFVELGGEDSLEYSIARTWSESASAVEYDDMVFSAKEYAQNTLALFMTENNEKEATDNFIMYSLHSQKALNLTLLLAGENISIGEIEGINISMDYIRDTHNMLRYASLIEGYYRVPGQVVPIN